jgi:hypothetical protein
LPKFGDPGDDGASAFQRAFERFERVLIPPDVLAEMFFKYRRSVINWSVSVKGNLR